MVLSVVNAERVEHTALGNRVALKTYAAESDSRIGDEPNLGPNRRRTKKAHGKTSTPAGAFGSIRLKFGVEVINGNLARSIERVNADPSKVSRFRQGL